MKSFFDYISPSQDTELDDSLKPRSFRMKRDYFFSSSHHPHALILLAGALLLGGVGLYVFQNIEDPGRSSHDKGSIVLGLAESIDRGDVDVYQEGVRSVVSQYLTQRVLYDERIRGNRRDTAAIAAWQDVASRAESELLSFTVPPHYQDVHLALAIALVSDQDHVRDFALGRISYDDFIVGIIDLSAVWDDIVSTNFWLE